MHRTLLATAIALSALFSLPASATSAPKNLQATLIGTYQSGLFEQSAAEIVAHDARTQRLFVVNAANARIDVLDIHDPAQPKLLFNIDLSAYGSGINSVAVHRGLVAAAVENPVKTEPGSVVLMNIGLM